MNKRKIRAPLNLRLADTSWTEVIIRIFDCFSIEKN